jgi:hypothetical protein
MTESEIINEIERIFNKTSQICGLCIDSCCKKCADNNAYFVSLLDNGQFCFALEGFKSQNAWDNSAGFLSATGCALKHEYRSAKCLGEMCGRLVDSMDKNDVRMIGVLTAGLRRIRIENNKVLI